MVTFTLIWIILNEKPGWPQILTGLTLSLTILAFTNSQLLLEDYQQLYPLRLITLIRYFFHLIGQIYKSGFSAITRIIRGDDAVQFVDYVTTLDDDLTRTLLANAITLTPGTVTANLDRQVLRVLTFQAPTVANGRKRLWNQGRSRDMQQSMQDFENILRGDRR